MATDVAGAPRLSCRSRAARAAGSRYSPPGWNTRDTWPEPVPSRATRRTVLEARGLLLGFADPAPGAVEVLPDGSVGDGGVRLRPLPPLDADTPYETGCAHESFEPLASGAGLLLSVIAETSLAAMPPDSDPDRAGTRPAGGRRLLVFSDSRREARPARAGAHLGP